MKNELKDGITDFSDIGMASNTSNKSKYEEKSIQVSLDHKDSNYLIGNVIETPSIVNSGHYQSHIIHMNHLNPGKQFQNIDYGLSCNQMFTPNPSFAINPGYSSHNLNSFTDDMLHQSGSSGPSLIALKENQTQVLRSNSGRLYETDWFQQTSPDGREYYYNSKTLQSVWETPQEVTLAKEKEKMIVEQQKNQPIGAESIPGTIWLMVQSANGKVFFFNPINKTSIWERPLELMGNIMVDALTQKFKDNYESKNLIQTEKYTENAIDSTPTVSVSLVSADDNIEYLKNIELYKKLPPDQRQELFRSLMVENKISAFSTWEKVSSILETDCRYFALSAKDRKQCFNDFISVRAGQEKEQSKIIQQKKRCSFIKFLTKIFQLKIISYTEFKLKYADDKHFMLILKPTEREAIFNECLEEFHEEKMKLEKLSKPKEPKDILDFFEMLDEISDKIDISECSWDDLKVNFKNDSRYKNIRASHVRRHVFRRYMKEKTFPFQSTANKAEAMIIKEKEARALFSLKEREREVEEERREIERQRRKNRSSHQHDTAVENYTALLSDLVMEPKISWRESRHILRNDPRYNEDILPRDEQQDIFYQHIENLDVKRQKIFCKVLNDHVHSLTVKWRDVRQKVKDDARLAKILLRNSKMEAEFDKYMVKRIENAKVDLHHLLSEIKMIDHKLKSRIEAYPAIHRELVSVLSKDKRYHQLEFISEQRDSIIDEHLTEMERRGTPPPPTATNPSARFR